MIHNEELRLRRWAREHYVPAHERKEKTWHPVVLDEMGKKNGLGYIVISGKYTTKYTKDDGTLLITKGEDRGYQPVDKK